MAPSAIASRDRYLFGRKGAIVLSFAMVATVGIMQSSVLGRNSSIRFSEDSAFHQKSAIIKFQLDPNEFWTLEISGYHPKKGDAKAVKSIAAALEQKLETNDKDGKAPLTKHLEALEWHRYSEVLSDVENKHSTAKKRLLMAQYSNQDDFADLFEITKPVNLAYAKRWNHDIVFLNAQELPTHEANLATLLYLAWEHREKYDQVLLMDADAMMNNFRYDITKLFPENAMMVAKRIEGLDEVRTWKIFGTVSLWNLKHLLTPRVQITWSNRFEEKDPLIGLGEQVKPYAETEVYTVTKQIGHFDSSYIRTMQYATKNDDLRKIDRKTRIERWANEAKRTCKKYHIDCSSVTAVKRRA